jgi:hypothetical protein
MIVTDGGHRPDGTFVHWPAQCREKIPTSAGSRKAALAQSSTAGNTERTHSRQGSVTTEIPPDESQLNSGHFPDCVTELDENDLANVVRYRVQGSAGARR